LLAPFILLGLAIMFTPKIIRLIREVIDKKRG